MSYNKENKIVEVADPKPIEELPLSETFKDDLFVLRERYAPKEARTNFLDDFWT